MGTTGNLKRLLVAACATAALLTLVTVSGAASGPSISTFDQCANGGPPSSATDCPSNWINGILNANNSHYAEDDVTPQRTVIDLPQGSATTGRTVEISYLARKGGVHAYDSLATWNFTQTSADRCANLPAADCIAGPPSTIGIPSDPTVVADSGGSGSATSGHQLSGQVFTLYGGTLTGVSSYTHDDPSGTGDEYAHVTLTYSVPSTDSGATVMLLFGGHIAAGLGPRGWGPGLGAGSIAGGPYHIRITGLDGGSVGNRDNQIMSNAILAPANIVIKKVSVGGDGTFNYTATGGISSSFSIATSGGTGEQDFTNITHGAYTVTEGSLPSGWDFTNLVCSDPTSNSSVNAGTKTATINLDPGETVTCTYTNTKRGKIVVEKQTNPDGDPQLFTFTPSYGSSFQLSDGQQNDSGFLVPGTYSVSEAVPAGWDQASATCDDGSSPSSIGLSAGETVKCTFTNTKRAHLIVIKHVVNDNGGTAVASAWSMHVKQSGSDISGSPFSGAESPGTSKEVVPGSYNVSESGGPSGYALTYSGACDSSGNVSVAAGETKTCTLANDDVAPQLTVIKHVVNDNGGTAVASAWTMQIKQGVSVVQAFPGAESLGTTKSVSVGSYKVVETGGPGGYTASYSGDCDSSGNVTVALGESKTCTITNDDQAASLTVIKHVINDNGGGASAGDFTMSINGVTAAGGNSFAGAESPGVTKTLTSVGSYNVTEGAVPGYAQVSASAGCSGTIALGESKTCTITNDDQAASLTVIKHVINDNGGGASAGDFTMTVNGASAAGGNSFAGAESPGVTKTLTSLGSYNVSESTVPGYVQVSASAGCSGTIALGESKTCTITNDDQAASLTVIKHVVNNDGGSADASAWTMQIKQGASVVQSFAGAETPGTTRSVSAGTYNVGETGGPSGYALSYSGDCDSQGNVTVALGQSKTCTLTNDDQAASLTVIKHVINDNGGGASAGDFTMTVNGVSAAGGNSFAGAESPGVTKTLTSLGSYNVSESSVAGYTQVSASADCSGTIALGESKTCTIVNDDKAATLTVIKHVANSHGGNATAGDFTMSINGVTAAGGNSFAGAEDPGVTKTLTSVGSYNVSESSVAGYTQVSASADCSGTIALGESKTCTIVNSDQPAHLIVKKVVVNDNGGTKTASDFSFMVNDGQAQAFEADGQNDLTVDAGTYNVTEPAVGGYTSSYDGCSNIVLAPGETATCTVTNDDQPATLIVKKVVVNDNGGTKIVSDFSFQVNGGEAQSFEGDGQNDLTVNAGTYNVTEPGVVGYDTTYDNCSQIVLGLGDTATCTITNNDQPATLIVKKVVVNDNGGTKTASDFSFQVNGGAAQAFESDGQNNLSVDAGTYNVTEPAVAGYTTTYAGCANIVLGIGETATCTVTNNDVPAGQGSISVSKSADPTSMKEPGGPVTFSVRITNTSLDVDVVITNVVDDKFGDLDDDGGNGCFDVPITLHPGGFVSCQFTKPVTGPGGTTHVDTVTASGHDENGNPVSASDDATVQITPRLIDLVVVKDATSPTPLNGIVHYTMTVTNKGPDTATNVQLADPAPAGITYLTASPSQGTCAVDPALITCSLGSLAAGQKVTISVTARATTVGSHTNTATVTGGGGRETNPADNVDTAVTIVPAPIKPPTQKPQPAPQPCLALTVTPKMIKADGKTDRVVAKVTAGGRAVKGAKVVIQGAGVRQSGRTNAAGIVVIRINPRKAGLITITTPETHRSCGARRIGVVGVFLPPLTG